jgi:probable F420-dependent oxidoreductase
MFDRSSWRELARRVEGLGFSTLAVADHVGPLLAPLPAMAIAAEATTELRVATMVMANDLRNPVLVARDIGTLDLLLDGRVEVGLGTGWMPSDYAATGVPLDRAGVRISRLDEAVQIMTTMWSDGSCTFAGDHYQVEAATWRPPEPRRPPSLLIGGGGRRVLELAARHADVVSLNFIPGRAWGPDAAATALAERFDERVGWVKAAAGGRLDRIELHCMAILCDLTGDRTAALERFAAPLDLTPAQVADMPLTLVGSPAEIADTLRARRDRYGISYVTVRADLADAFAPVIKELDSD